MHMIEADEEEYSESVNRLSMIRHDLSWRRVPTDRSALSSVWPSRTHPGFRHHRKYRVGQPSQPSCAVAAGGEDETDGSSAVPAGATWTPHGTGSPATRGGGGVLNPAVAWGRDGQLYLFPRVVAERNYPRIGIGQVIFDAAGRPAGVDRMGYALEPKMEYELRPDTCTGGCEDPRVTYIEPLDLYVMAYTVWGRSGPRVALAISEDVLTWQRLGVADFQPGPDPVHGAGYYELNSRHAAFSPVR